MPEAQKALFKEILTNMNFKPMKYILLFIFSTLLNAHPHCFVDVYPTIKKDSINIKWVFDEMSSQMLIMDFDTNHDGKIDKKESEYIYKEAFMHLREYDYYIYMHNGKKKLKTPDATGFKASIKNFRFTYIFTIKLNKDITDIDFYDEDMFTAFVVEPEFLKIKNNSKKITLKEMDHDYFYGYKLEFK